MHGDDDDDDDDDDYDITTRPVIRWPRSAIKTEFTELKLCRSFNSFGFFLGSCKQKILQNLKDLQNPL